MRATREGATPDPHGDADSRSLDRFVRGNPCQGERWNSSPRPPGSQIGAPRSVEGRLFATIRPRARSALRPAASGSKRPRFAAVRGGSGARAPPSVADRDERRDRCGRQRGGCGYRTHHKLARASQRRVQDQRTRRGVQPHHRRDPPRSTHTPAPPEPAPPTQSSPRSDRRAAMHADSPGATGTRTAR
jgi:hypothetical protein